MSAQTTPKLLTYDEWLRLPETNQPCEVIDGVLRVLPAPGYIHQQLVCRLLLLMEQHVPEMRGEILPSPMDVIISRSPLRVRQPDIMVALYREGSYQNEQELMAAPHGEVVPDLVVEILSPGETRTSLSAKIEDYRHVGVREIWLVSPEAETVEVLRLNQRGVERIGLYGKGDTVRSEVLPDLQIDTSRLFA
ncbi:MAG: Uma2 family endonuclease [Chthonomonadetes bacterium]|nr:Uma2 family endonuclease [Chthonomonadetes bacterium]